MADRFQGTGYSLQQIQNFVEAGSSLEDLQKALLGGAPKADQVGKLLTTSQEAKDYKKRTNNSLVSTFDNSDLVRNDEETTKFLSALTTIFSGRSSQFNTRKAMPGMKESTSTLLG
jgi:hypothetical protein